MHPFTSVPFFWMLSCVYGLDCLVYVLARNLFCLIHIFLVIMDGFIIKAPDIGEEVVLVVLRPRKSSLFWSINSVAFVRAMDLLIIDIVRPTSVRRYLLPRTPYVPLFPCGFLYLG